jgi:hypothetical protein
VITYDSQTGDVLLFGGGDGYGGGYGPPGPSAGDSNETWTFTHGQWTQLHTAHTPAARYLASMVYDPDIHGVLMVDGCYATNIEGHGLACSVYIVGLYDPGSDLEDQWTFSGRDWHPTKLPKEPGYDSFASMTYDPAAGYVLFYAGPNETWAFQHGHWRHLRATSSPPVNGLMSMTYDAADRYILLFGGTTVPANLGTIASVGTGTAETWTFSQGEWTQLHPAVSPPPTAGGAMAYDAKDGYVLLFGGANNTSLSYSDTWTFVHGQWTELHPAVHPSARTSSAMAYDAADGYVVLFGGSEYLSTGVISGNPAAYGDTWTFVGGIWTHLDTPVAPSNRSEGAMAYDGVGVTRGNAAGGVILLGGLTLSGPVSDTWLFLHGTWRQLNVSSSPPTAWGMAFAYDAADGRIIVQGGESYLSGENPGNSLVDMQDTWELRIL